MKEISDYPICFNCNSNLYPINNSLYQCIRCNYVVIGIFRLCNHCMKPYYILPIHNKEQVNLGFANQIIQYFVLCQNTNCSSNSIFEYESYYIISNKYDTFKVNKEISTISHGITNLFEETFQLTNSKMIKFINKIIRSSNDRIKTNMSDT